MSEESEESGREGAGTARICPRCGSDHLRRGGNRTWLLFIALIALAVVAVVVVHLQAGLVAAALVVLIFLTHVVLREWTCQDCGAQW
jgi:Flp pilus assembly protein TadB